MGDNWKLAISKNIRKLKKGMANPEDVVDSLFTDEIITEEMKASILQYQGEPEKMAGEMLQILLRRGHKALPALYKAFIESKNTNLAELLEPHVKQLANELMAKEDKYEPSEWPPNSEEKDRMRKDKVILSDIALSKSQYNNQENYQMNKEVRGTVLIINNIEFDVLKDGPLLSYRDGSDEDEKDVTELFKQLHFNVQTHSNLTGDKIIEVAEKESNKIGKADNCFICVIMSHGCRDGIFGVDGKVVTVDLIKEKFDSKHCPALNGKPKIFLIQACRGKDAEVKGKPDLKPDKGSCRKDVSEPKPDKESGAKHEPDPKPDKESGAKYEPDPKPDEERGTECTQDPKPDGGITETTGVQTTDGRDTDISKVTEQMAEASVLDSQPSSDAEKEGVPQFHSAADFLIAYATPQGYGAWRHKERGSWFLQAVVWVFKYHAHHEKLTEMLTRVNRFVASGVAKDKQGNEQVTVSDYSSSQIRGLYFFPGMVGETHPVRPRELRD